MKTPVASTARWMAAARAKENDRADRLFDDPYAKALAGTDGLSLQDQMKLNAGDGKTMEDNPYIAVRTRYFDDALLGALCEGHIQQVVLLAAGMDARAFRLRWPEGTRVFEVDYPELFAQKEAILRDMNAAPLAARHVVGADLEGHEWTAALAAAGFQRDKRAAFLMEGLIMYLDEKAVHALFRTLQAIAAPGSRLFFDVPNDVMLTSPFTRPFFEKLAAFGCPWRFSTSEPEAFLAPYGWEATAVMAGEPTASYGRWPYPSVPRGTPNIPVYFFMSGSWK